ncbi:MAG: thioredoxin [Gammaproteobacteria bacterium]
MAEFATLERLPGLTPVLFAASAYGACRRMPKVSADGLPRGTDCRVYMIGAGRDVTLTREFEVFHLPVIFLYVDGRFHRQLRAPAAVPGLQQALAAPAQEAP